MLRFFCLALLLLPNLASAADVPKPIPTKEEEKIIAAFSPSKAAEYLDGVNLAWTRERKCFSCHTNVMYMLARPQLEGGDAATLKELRTFLETTVTGWTTKKPRTDYEVLTAAFALAAHDSVTTKKLHEKTRLALEKSWTLQKPDGSWNWPKCDWPPMEHDDYYGVTFMAVAVGLAPEAYAKTESAKKAIGLMQTYLQKHPAPDLHHKAMLLWAASLMDGWMTNQEKQKTIQELQSKQKEDGGWSLPSLGIYQRHNGKPNDPNAPSDGYATGYVIYILRQAGVKADDPTINKGIQWLKTNQRETGRWYTRSLSNDKAHYITNAGSAFAVLAWTACDKK